MKPFNRTPDRYDKNKSDGQEFLGFDNKETKTTEWYTKDGTLDSVTRTPYDEDDDD